jgi:hypothetical protein
MKFDDTTGPYLRGEAFSNGLAVTMTPEPDDVRLRSRIDWLCELCARHDVVHVGCVDHDIAQAQHKLARGKWLHARLDDATSRCLGVDIDAPGIEQLRETFGYTDLLAANLLEDECAPITEHQWDDMVLAEVLEHIGDPVTFLKTLNIRFGERFQRFIITVPNAFAEENFKAARRGVEAINTDHRFWFTPYTLAKVVVDAGLTPERVIACRNGVVKRRSFFKNRRLTAHPLLRNNLIMIARPPHVSGE